MRNLKSFTDDELITLHLEGDKNAFNVIVLRHKEKIHTSIYLLVKDKYLAEDIFQDTFIKVINSINSGNYNDSQKFVWWVIRIAHNLCINYFRKIKQAPIIRTREDRDIFEVINFSETGADQKMVLNQVQEKIREMIDTLPKEQREVIILRHYAELSFKEIADLTRCSINTALSRMRYALINLRKIIKVEQIVL